MNKEIFKGHWNEMKGKIEQQWGKFTNDEVQHLQGNYDEFLGAMQKKYGYEKEEAEKQINEFMKKNHWDH